MSDNFYAIEWMLRERAREVERDLRRRRLLAQASRPHRPGTAAVLIRRLGQAMVRTGHGLLRRVGESTG